MCFLDCKKRRRWQAPPDKERKKRMGQSSGPQKILVTNTASEVARMAAFTEQNYNASGEVVAVKRIHSAEADRTIDEKSFQNEVENCQVLLVLLLSSTQLSVLQATAAAELDWVKRVDIVKDVARALSYMDHDCARPIVHRDKTSDNILLDSDSKAYVSDFVGIARLLKPDSSNSTALAGTHGYLAPAKFLEKEAPSDPFFSLRFLSTCCPQSLQTQRGRRPNAMSTV